MRIIHRSNTPSTESHLSQCKVRSRLVSIVIVCVISLIFTQGSRVEANSIDLRAEMIPATACQPQSSSEAAKIFLSNAGWAFLGGATGTVYLWCPLPLHRFSHMGRLMNELSFYNIHYRDTDADGGDAEVAVTLYERTAPNLFIVNDSTWTSNSFPFSGTEGNFQTKSVGPIELSGNFYSFQVQMTRNNVNESPSFFGIGFFLRKIL